MLRKEIINSSVTFKNWEILKKVCSTQEFKEIKSLKVESAIFHLDSDITENFNEYLDFILKDKGTFSFSKKLCSTVDTRGFQTFIFPLKDFVQPLN